MASEKLVYKKIDWVVDYLLNIDSRVDILNSNFVDAYASHFGVKVEIQPFGANKCRDLGKTLSAGFSMGIFNRGRVGLSGKNGMELGFPKWVYVYSLPNSIKESAKDMCKFSEFYEPQSGGS